MLLMAVTEECILTANLQPVISRVYGLKRTTEKVEDSQEKGRYISIYIS